MLTLELLTAPHSSLIANNKLSNCSILTFLEEKVQVNVEDQIKDQTKFSSS
jgi:hypothetical protein